MTIAIRWLGHSAFEMDIDGHNVVLDPFLTGNDLAAAAPGDLSPEVILLSHAHGDHLGDTVEIARANNALVITNFEVGNYLLNAGVEQVHQQNPGGGFDHGFMHVKFTVAHHSSSFPDGTYGGVPVGMVISAYESGKRIYFAGDTDLFSDMGLIGELGIDLAILPIGDNFTMGPDDSLRAIQFIQPQVVMPMHYNTFPPIVQDVSAWAHRVNNETDAQPVVLDPGGTYTLE